MKRKGWRVLAILCIGFIALFYFGGKQDGVRMKKMLLETKPEYLLLAALSFLSYLAMEALAYRNFLRHLGYRVGFFHCYRYALSDFFFSSVSPGGSAGQLGQYMIMTQDKIESAHALMSLFSFNMVYHMTMIGMAVGALVLGVTQRVAKLPALKVLIIFGLLVQIYCVCLIFFLMFSKRVPDLAEKFFTFLNRIPFLKRFVAKRESLKKHFEEQKETGEYLAGHPILILQLFLYTIPLFIFYYSVPFFVARALGFHVNWIQVIAIQSVAMLALESVPLPGGVGLAEGSFLAVYDMISPGAGFTMMLLARSINFYLGLSLGALVLAFTEKTRILKQKRLKWQNKHLFKKQTDGA